MTENWLPIKGFEGFYSVSDQGRVRSETRTITGMDGVPQTHKGMILKPAIGRGRRLRISLQKPGIEVRRQISHLVLEAFDQPRPPGAQALHWDDNPANNAISNLRWGTHSENLLDRVRNGTHHYANRDECSYGHEFTPDNTIIRTDGGRRRCRICFARRNREYRARKKAAMNT